MRAWAPWDGPWLHNTHREAHDLLLEGIVRLPCPRSDDPEVLACLYCELPDGSCHRHADCPFRGRKA